MLLAIQEFLPLSIRYPFYGVHWSLLPLLATADKRFQCASCLMVPQAKVSQLPHCPMCRAINQNAEGLSGLPPILASLLINITYIPLLFALISGASRPRHCKIASASSPPACRSKTTLCTNWWISWLPYVRPSSQNKVWGSILGFCAGAHQRNPSWRIKCGWRLVCTSDDKVDEDCLHYPNLEAGEEQKWLILYISRCTARRNSELAKKKEKLKQAKE